MSGIISVNMNGDIESQGISAIHRFLEEKNFSLTNPRFKVSIIDTNSNQKKWYVDDVCIVRFIVSMSSDLGGESIQTKNGTIRLKYGEGYVLGGAEGHALLGLEPSIHCSPNKYTMFSVSLDAIFNIHELVKGENIASYESSLYKERLEHVYSLVNI
jgi:hypothetical protein